MCREMDVKNMPVLCFFTCFQIDGPMIRAMINSGIAV